MISKFCPVGHLYNFNFYKKNMALLHFHTPPLLLLMTHDEKTAENFTIALTLTLGGYESAIVSRILPPARTIWAFQGVSLFSIKCSSTVHTKSALDLVGQFFLKMMLWGEGGESTMDDVMIMWLLVQFLVL